MYIWVHGPLGMWISTLHLLLEERDFHITPNYNPLRVHVHVCIYIGLKVSLYRYFRANVDAIWAHGPLGTPNFQWKLYWKEAVFKQPLSQQINNCILKMLEVSKFVTWLEPYMTPSYSYYCRTSSSWSDLNCISSPQGSPFMYMCIYIYNRPESNIKVVPLRALDIPGLAGVTHVVGARQGAVRVVAPST